MAVESPFVTAFWLLLKWGNIPMPDGIMNMFQMYEAISSTLHSASYSIDMTMDHNPRSYTGGNGDNRNVYDFIIVGGGVSGSIIAMRLCEKYKVLVLEAGAEPTFLINPPMYNYFQWTSNDTDWGYHSIPQTDTCLACRKKSVKYLQGKALGGTMTLGHSVYSRGNPLDFEYWANATNDSSWTYDRLIKVFKKTENYRGKWDDSSNHGFTGLLKINYQTYQPLNKEWVEGGLELGVREKDPNEVQGQTFTSVEVSINEGRRQNVYDQILKKELWRKNLKVTRYATVEKIVLDKRNRATGVIYRRGHQSIQVRANKEVILCAGVFNTPKLLMLSGIGPEDHLREMSIKVKKHHPQVGQNLQDHPTTVYGPVTVVHDKTFLAKRNLTYSVVMEYYTNQSGPLGSNIMSGLGYISTPGENEEWPNIQYTLFPSGIDSESGKALSTAFDLKGEYMKKFLKDIKDNDAVWVFVSLSRPKSRGSVRLKSNHWETHPIIDPKYFSVKEDMVNMVEGLKYIQKLFDTTPWSNLDARLISTPFSGCERFKVKTDHYYECLANHLTISMGSLGGTCRMGLSKNDSVVDSKLLVHRVKRLRIADASVMPLLPNAFPGAATMAVAEKAAEMILEKWEYEVAKFRDKSSEGDA